MTQDAVNPEIGNDHPFMRGDRNAQVSALMSGNVDIAEIDNRNTPRITADFPLEADGLKGRSVNINDGGICFLTMEPVVARECVLNVYFPADPVKVRVQIRWNSKDNGQDGFTYGASFIRPENHVMTIIRRYMISKQFRFVVHDIKDSRTRKHVLQFAKDFRDYLFALVDLSNKGYIRGDVQTQLTCMNDEIVRKGDDLGKRIENKMVMKTIKNEFRSLVSCWAFKSQIMKRGFSKPRGYPGDSDTLEVIYDKKTFSRNREIGYCFDVYFLENPYAEAVRNRKDTLCKILREFLSNRIGQTKILNLACGSSREVWELYCGGGDEKNTRSAVEFTLLDWDEHALEFSRNRLKSVPGNVKLTFIKEDIVQFVKNMKFFDRTGKQDLIYSIGLADYLPDRVLKKMIKNSFEGLNHDGKFIIAHKDKKIEFSHLPPEWFCDWEFIERDQEDMLNLVDSSGISAYSYGIEREKSGQIFFITVTRK